jgi:protein involved in polysaccharide export with SLBB domain
MLSNLIATAIASIVVLSASAPSRADDGQVPPAATTAVPAAAKFTVHVVGRVKHPGTLQLDAGARLSDALTAAGADFETLIARAGGTPVPDTDCVLGGPSLRQVYLTRTTAASKPATYAIDVSMARQQHDVRYDPLLRDDDRIYVPQCRPKVKVILTPPTFPTPLNG